MGLFVHFRVKFDQNSVQNAAKWINGNWFLDRYCIEM